MDILDALLRWIHILAGVIWIGMLYFFNWVNGPFAATLDAESKKKIVPELMPRALFWFRWGAAWDLAHRLHDDAARLLPRRSHVRRRR